jgi:rare lipoprotein A
MSVYKTEKKNPGMLNRRRIGAGLVASSMVLLTACTSTKPLVQRDSGPEQPLDVAHIPDPVPRWEPRTAAGNKSPYTVLGKTYHLLSSSDNYREQGFASWYGRKFHGAQTSNGEIYDMYGMTAAHKTLPIPTFVRVKNLENGREVIVRVNDRGPFHDGRIIDLTYTAAKKLGFVEQGVARVEVTAIDPATWADDRGENVVAGTQSGATGQPAAPAPWQSAGYQLPANTFLQAGAFGSEASANALREQLLGLTSLPVFVTSADTLKRVFRVRIGPISDNFELINLQERIRQLNLGIPHIVQE